MKTISFLILLYAGFSYCKVEQQSNPASNPSPTSQTFSKDWLFKGWVLIQSIKPIIAANDASLGADTFYFLPSMQEEVLHFNQDNTYEIQWKKEDGSAEKNSEKGTWELKDTSIQFHCGEGTSDRRSFCSQWEIVELVEFGLILRYQTRAGYIYKTYSAEIE